MSLAQSDTPLGLIVAAVGGSPIEYWIPPMPDGGSGPPGNYRNPCELDSPQCDNKMNDTSFFSEYIEKLLPYTIGGLIWDQAERDVKCPQSLQQYPCLQNYLISSWRESFNASFAFVAVQLAGYTAALKNGTGTYPGDISSEMVFTMRLQQENGCRNISGGCSVVPTYDFSCQAGTEGGCPYGSVHQPDKAGIGSRIGGQLYKLLVDPETSRVVEGPRATRAVATTSGGAGYTVTVHFSGGTTPFALKPTRNCTSCCDAEAAAAMGRDYTTVDFDASVDGLHFVNGTGAALASVGDGTSLSFVVRGLSAAPTVVRYTAASIWPQCAVYNAEGLAAYPFVLTVDDSA